MIPHADFLDCPAGLVEYYFAEGVFHWSEGLYRIYGYERGDVAPSMDMALAHMSRQAVLCSRRVGIAHEIAPRATRR
jgi:hypothetical protein